LLLLNELFELGWSWRKLAEFSADYGSDIAFFTQPQAAACYGRGEVVEPFSSPSAGWFVVVRPPFGLGTPAVFAELAHERLGSVPIPNGSHGFYYFHCCIALQSQHAVIERDAHAVLPTTFSRQPYVCALPWNP
ncbi:MAG: hypothetical protein JNK57_18475, partial [Planctomycetaceae bacterium]|nr:hypothetical protein [Planctomycetaceae bacterium]